MSVAGRRELRVDESLITWLEIVQRRGPGPDGSLHAHIDSGGDAAGKRSHESRKWLLRGEDNAVVGGGCLNEAEHPFSVTNSPAQYHIDSCDIGALPVLSEAFWSGGGDAVGQDEEAIVASFLRCPGEGFLQIGGAQSTSFRKFVEFKLAWLTTINRKDSLIEACHLNSLQPRKTRDHGLEECQLSFQAQASRCAGVYQDQ